MAKYTVYEKQVKIVAYEVEAESEDEAMSQVSALGMEEYDYVVSGDSEIESAEIWGH